MDGSVFTTTIAARYFGLQDICIAILTDELPEYIVPAKILPVTFLDHVTAVYYSVTQGIPRAVPICRTDQQGKLLTDELFYLNTGASFSFPTSGLNRKDETEPCYENIISGDSGSGVYAVINNELLLITSSWTPILGPFYGYFADSIQDILYAHGGGTLQIADLSDFPTY
jgi:hypothetical protein